MILSSNSLQTLTGDLPTSREVRGEVVGGSQGSWGGFFIKIPENTLVYKRGTTDLLILTSKHSQVTWKHLSTSVEVMVEVVDGSQGSWGGFPIKIPEKIQTELTLF